MRIMNKGGSLLNTKSKVDINFWNGKIVLRRLMKIKAILFHILIGFHWILAIWNSKRSIKSYGLIDWRLNILRGNIDC